MNNLEFLEGHKAAENSQFVERARSRRENAGWLRWSRRVALALVDYMQAHRLSRSELAQKLGVSPQYVSKLLSGTMNLSFKSVAGIEEALGISCLDPVPA